MKIHSLTSTSAGLLIQGSYLAPGSGTFSALFQGTALLYWTGRRYSFTPSDLFSLVEKISLQ